MGEILTFRPRKLQPAHGPGHDAAEVIRFPVALPPLTQSNGPGRARAFVSDRFLKNTDPNKPGVRSFRADLFLVNEGRDVAFSLLFPAGRISPALVAAMLRRAALSLDPKKPH